MGHQQYDDGTFVPRATKYLRTTDQIARSSMRLQ
jgi:hypothetical protein